MASPGSRRTRTAGCTIFRTALPSACDGRGAPSAGAPPRAQRDSGSHFHANATLTSTRAAANTPGAASPNRCMNDPIAGPTMTPALVAADSQPSALARSAGTILSATYACRTPVVQAYVADSMVPAERAKALGWLSAATSAGVIVGPAIGSFMHRFGDAAPGVFAAALVLVNVAFAWKWLPESRWARGGAPAVGAPRPSQALGKAVRNIVQPAVRVLREPGEAISLFIWIYALAMLAFNALPPIFSLYLHDRFGITADEIGYFFMVFGAVGVIMRAAPVGWVNARLGEVRTMRAGALLLLLGFILVPLAPTLPLFV